MEEYKYDRLDFNVGKDVEFIKIIHPDSDADTVYPFKHQLTVPCLR